jgi:hypothetical protein
VVPFHELFPPASAEIEAQRSLQRLVADPFTIVVDGRLVIPTIARGDPGGFPV